MKALLSLGAWAFIAAFCFSITIMGNCRSKQTLELQKRATQALETMAAKKCQ